MFKVKIVSIQGYLPSQIDFVENALEKFERAMNSDELKRRVVNFTSKLGNTFEDNEGFSNQAIFDILYASAEVYKTEIDNTADLYLELVKKNKPWPSLFFPNPSIGYSNPTQKEIYTFSWWFNQTSDWAYAGHIAHEWCHKLGFEHAHKPNATRQYSVPYAFQNIVESICKTY
jgi:hypothetical protein